MDFTRLEPVDYGWSGDRKYHAWGKDGREYFLRVCPLAKSGKARRAYDFQRWAWERGLPVSRPVELTEKEGALHYVEEWLPGQMAEAALPGLPTARQRRLGEDAGRVLKELHSFPAPAERESWEQSFGRKLEQKVELYRACPYQYEGGEAFIAFLRENRGLLRGRPQRVLHGDYHVGNMMLCGGRLFVIDFDRPKTGDPWQEFNRIVWCAQLSPAFASGMVEGYFGGRPPMEFWRLLALYMAVNCLSSLPWAVPFGQEQVDIMQKQAREVLAWYDGMERAVPAWYSPE